MSRAHLRLRPRGLLTAGQLEDMHSVLRQLLVTTGSTHLPTYRRSRCSDHYEGDSVNPGFFRTELLTEESTNFAERAIEDYNERRAKQMEFWKGYNGQQSGDPAKLAQALIAISSQANPPRRFIAGADAVETAEKVAATTHSHAITHTGLR